MALEDVEARVRVRKDERMAEISTNDIDVDALVATISAAAALASKAPKQPDYPGFAGPGEPTPQLDRYSAATAEASDAHRTDLVMKAIDRIRDEGLIAAGMLETSVHASVVATTEGCARAHDGTQAHFRVFALEDAAGRGASGYGSSLDRDIGALTIESDTDEAIFTAKNGRNPGRVDAGTWDVVMEPPAVAELLEWLGMVSFTAPEVEQGTSALAGRIGERITGNQIQIAEDPFSNERGVLADPFDREGTIRRRVSIIENGIARGVLFDRLHASRNTKKGVDGSSTGSAIVPELGTRFGVGTVALSLAGGRAKTTRELIAGVTRGLYIRRLHYVNGLVEPRRAVMTGLSRDGCFAIESGAVARAVGNVRMTDSFLEMLDRAEAMTAERKAILATWTEHGSLHVPAILFRNVRFSSGSRA